jgi:lipoprotein-anchoring transpeptidase ErfK/SrfK
MSKRAGRSLSYGRISLVAVFFVAALTWGAFGRASSLACANTISCIKDLSGRYEEAAAGTYLGRSVTPPAYIASNLIAPQVLGKTSEEKRIEVNLTTQQLVAFEGKKPVMTFPVSTGKWGRTPTGEFTIWIKLKYTRMEGGSGSDYYNLPNVPYVMFFSNDEVAKSRGFSLHGAYWHNNFGYVMSHGCVNLKPADAEKLYTWADPPTDGNITYVTKDKPGTKVTIYE